MAEPPPLPIALNVKTQVKYTAVNAMIVLLLNRMSVAPPSVS